jgi:two-component sensor histidine kinase
MLLILSLGLLPLGIIAVLASIDSARQNRTESEIETRAVLSLAAQRFNSTLSRSFLTIRAAGGAVAQVAPDSAVCETTLRRLARLHSPPGLYALYGPGNELRCASPGFAPPALDLASRGVSSRLDIRPDGSGIDFILFGEDGQIEGAGHYPTASLAAMTAPPNLRGEFDLQLVQGRTGIPLRSAWRDRPLARDLLLSQPVANGRMELRIRSSAVPISANEMIMILLPVLMWLFAAVIGWLIVNRLLLRPLGEMQRVVAAYQPGDRALDLPRLHSPAREISELGSAFDRVTRTVARHEAELEAAVERQSRLVREVHHRVKNNLQVVASLLNLHSRGSKNEDVAAAYASIQRRVDALAVVHRNHYAELEENRGVALRSLISELGANLRGTAPPSAAGMQIRLDIDPFYVNQDVAVSVAFLVTEIVEFGMLCGARQVMISLDAAEPGFATLKVESDSLAGEIACDQTLFTRFDRIITGLSRQLRSSLDRDPDRGSYAVRIAVVDKSDS